MVNLVVSVLTVAESTVNRSKAVKVKKKLLLHNTDLRLTLIYPFVNLYSIKNTFIDHRGKLNVVIHIKSNSSFILDEDDGCW